MEKKSWVFLKWSLECFPVCLLGFVVLVLVLTLNTMLVYKRISVKRAMVFVCTFTIAVAPECTAILFIVMLINIIWDQALCFEMFMFPMLDTVSSSCWRTPHIKSFVLSRIYSLFNVYFLAISRWHLVLVLLSDRYHRRKHLKMASQMKRGLDYLSLV